MKLVVAVGVGQGRCGRLRGRTRIPIGQTGGPPGRSTRPPTVAVCPAWRALTPRATRFTRCFGGEARAVTVRLAGMLEPHDFACLSLGLPIALHDTPVTRFSMIEHPARRCNPTPAAKANRDG